MKDYVVTVRMVIEEAGGSYRWDRKNAKEREFELHGTMPMLKSLSLDRTMGLMYEAVVQDVEMAMAEAPAAEESEG